MLIKLPTDLEYLDPFEITISKLVLDNEKKIPVSEFAKIAGKSTSLIYKSASIHDDTPFPITWGPAFQNLTGEYDILDLECRLTGHLPPVKIPSFRIEKTDEKIIINKVINSTHRVSEAFVELLERPDIKALKDYKKLAESALREILGSIYYADKAIKAQGELEL